MIKHVVLVKLKNLSDKNRAVEAFYSMKGKIEGLIDLEAGSDFLGSDRSYDVALVCTFPDKNALQYYQEHPVHQPVKKLMVDIRISSVTCDYEID